MRNSRIIVVGECDVLPETALYCCLQFIFYCLGVVRDLILILFYYMYCRLMAFDVPYFVHEWRVKDEHTKMVKMGIIKQTSSLVSPSKLLSDRQRGSAPASSVVGLGDTPSVALGRMDLGYVECGMKDECVSGAYWKYMETHAKMFRGKTVLHVCCGSGTVSLC